MVIGQGSADVENILNEAIKEIREIPKEQQNPELIGGLLLGSNNRSLMENTIETITKDDILKFHAFYLTRVIQPTLNDIEKLFSLVSKEDSTITYFRNFQYGQPLEKLTSNEIIDLCTKIESYGNPGKWTALSLLHMNGISDSTKWQQYAPTINKV